VDALEAYPPYMITDSRFHKPALFLTSDLL